jgi:hypothetical protein
VKSTSLFLKDAVDSSTGRSERDSLITPNAMERSRRTTAYRCVSDHLLRPPLLGHVHVKTGSVGRALCARPQRLSGGSAGVVTGFRHRCSLFVTAHARRSWRAFCPRRRGQSFHSTAPPEVQPNPRQQYIQAAIYEIGTAVSRVSSCRASQHPPGTLARSCDSILSRVLSSGHHRR